MQRLSLHTRQTWMLRGGLLLMLLIAIGAAWSSLGNQRQHREVLTLNHYRLALDQVQLASTQMVTRQRGYLISGDEAYLASYEAARLDLDAALAHFATFDEVAMGLSLTPTPLAALIANRQALLDQAVIMRHGLGPGVTSSVLEVDAVRRDIIGDLRDAYAALHRQADALAEQQQDRMQFEAYVTVSLIVAGLGLAAGLGATGVTLLQREVAAREATEAELRTRQAELARSNQELEQFAHIASHDLQEPLRMISSYTQLLGRRYAGKLDADADTYIGYAVDGTKRMQVLINDLLNYSRVTSSVAPLEAVDLEVALDETLKDLEIRIEDCQATVTHDALPTIKADVVQVRQLLLNLVANGMKFQPPERLPAVHISVVREGRDWHFGVRDNGIGIDAQYFKNLFQIFKRLHNTREYPGTGIGLAVCKKIVERHGGRIWVDSVLGQGSTFQFTLPAMEPTT